MTKTIVIRNRLAGGWLLAGVWLLLGGLTSANVWAAGPVRVSLGTLAPRGSIYHQSLQSMAEKWRQAPGGGVRLVIYPDGTQGGEADMVRLMRVGTLQAGLLTAVGLSELEPGVAGLQSFPLAFRDFDEFDYVNQRLRPMMERRLAEKGFMMLFWADAGWVRYFFKEPISTPEELKQRKVFAWSGSVEQVDIMKRLGYNPVPLETADILTSLQTGLINAVSVPPIYAARSQFHSYAPHMIDLKWAVLVGGLVIKQDTWERIPPETRKVLAAAAEAAGREIQANGRKEGEEAVAAMEKRGLKVRRLTPELEARWVAAAEETYPQLRGTIVPADIFDEVQRLLKEYRSNSSPSP
jgi:TRAP-type C4-dicarboxylate transport system substrate-binding protein